MRPAAAERAVFRLDDPAADPYVPSGMNLLMLLSALLSALTGVGAAVRRPEVAQSVARVAAAAEAARGTVAVAATRPVAVPPALKRRTMAGVTPAFALLPTIALWASRRRE